MKDITRLKEKYEKLYLQNCKCSDKIKCSCKRAAEIRAYWETVIPEPFYNYSIKHFNGRNNASEKILTTESAVEAKSQLLKYCWGNISLEDCNSLSDTEFNKRSIMDKRREEGTNIVIYSDYNELSDECLISKKPKGKTFVASLIMKEAIKRRTKTGHSTLTYDWIDFLRLRSILTSNDEASISNLKYTDWLVIEDIDISNDTENAKSFYRGKIEPFFNERNEDGLPTVFVFKFDISKPGADIEKQLGPTIVKIVNDPKTFKIKLV